MKKNMVRILAFVLVLILALGIIPLGALAADIKVDTGYFGVVNPTLNDHWVVDGSKIYTDGSTIKTSDYSKHVMYGDYFFDFQGFINVPQINKDANTFFQQYPAPTPDQLEAFEKATHIPFTSTVTIPKAGTPEYDKWISEWTFVTAAYTPHQHKLSYWYSDNTTHWRECLTCKKYLGHYYQFMFQNWHSDGDEDRVCDVCGHDIPYHEIEVEEVKGGKITVELNEAPHRKKIVATAEPEEGYKLKKIHFIKVRDNGTEQEITRRKTSTKGTWWAYMPTYDLKVTAEFVKKK